MSEEHEAMTEIFLPCGDDLVALLSQSALTDSFIRGLLRERGVLMGNGERAQMIEEFVLSYISPTEFEAVMDRLSTREEAFKLKTFTYKVSAKDVNLFSMVPKPDQFDIRDIARDPNGNYEIEGSPSFVKKDSGDFVMEYSLRMRNAGRSWIKSQQRFSGKMVLRKLDNDDENFYIKVYHSSSETKTVNNNLKRWIRKDLRERKIIESDSEKAIEFGDFTHEQRMAFLLQFTQKFPNEIFTFEKVTDFDFCVDDQLIPAGETRLVWMKGSVSRSSLKGKALHDIFVLKERDTWKFVKIWYIELKFNVSTADFDGTFNLSLEFDGYGGSSSLNSKFHFSVGQISSRKYKDSTEKVRRKIEERFDAYAQDFYAKAIAP